MLCCVMATVSQHCITYIQHISITFMLGLLAEVKDEYYHMAKMWL